MAFEKVASTGDVKAGEGLVITVRGRELALFHIGEEFFCLDNACPHMEGPLGEGYLAKDVVSCPWHAWQVNVRTGEVLYMPGVCVAAYPCRVDGDAILVELSA